MPDCRIDLYKDETETDDPTLVGENCHIIAESDDGPRADPTMPVDRRNSYANLILLCRNHHKVIDAQEGEYTVEQLHRMKANHEAWVRTQLGLATQIAETGSAPAFQSRIKAFLDEYLKSETGPVPFGGRDHELARLDAWLYDSGAASRCLVSGPAGRGKSALLVRWIERLQRSGALAETHSTPPASSHLVFVPISIRFGTNTQQVFYQALAERLAMVARQALERPATDAASFYADKVRDLLNELAQSNQRVLVVLDGLDEALGGEFDGTIFPRVLPPAVRVLISARWQLGDSDSSGWICRLDWDANVKCEAINLERLDGSAIGQILVGMGAPLDIVATDRNLVLRLAELTEGEPLLVGFYATDLWRRGESATPVTRADLDALRPGFGAYFDRWLTNQQTAWRAAGEHVNQRDVDAVLMILAFAYGPLQGTDLLALARRFPETTPALLSRQLLEPLRRFIVGSGGPERGYVLSHPRIGEHLQAQQFRDAIQFVHRAYAGWGREIVAEVNRRPDSATSVPSYLLQFLCRHLHVAGATTDDFLRLVEDGWRRAWEHYGGGPTGFAGDVRAAWDAVREHGPVARPGSQLRCILTLSSILSRGRNVPRDLIVAAVRNKVLSISQAIDLGNLIPDQAEHVLVLGALADGLEHGSLEQRRLLSEALAVAETIYDDYGRGRAFCGLAVRLAGEQRLSALNTALAAARMIDDDQGRATILTELAGQLTGEPRSIALSEALSAARLIDEDMFRADVLIGLADCFAGEALDQLIEGVFAIADVGDRTRALARIARHLSDEQLKQAMAAAKAIGTLSEFAAYLTPDQVREELTTAKMLGEYFRASAFGHLAPYMSGEQLQDICTAAGGIENEHARADALASLAPHLDAKQREAVISEALRAAGEIDLDFHGADVLNKLACFLSADQLEKALALAKRMSDPDSRAEALKGLADHLSARQLGEALRASMAISDHAERVGVLWELSKHLEDPHRSELVAQAFQTATTIGDEKARVAALKNLAAHLSSEQLSQALAAVRTISDWNTRADAFIGLADHLNADQRAEAIRALAEGNPVSSDFALSAELGALAVQFSGEQRGSVVRVALSVAKRIANEYERAKAVAELAGKMGRDQLEDAMEAANAIHNGHARAIALRGLAPHLTREQLGESLTAAIRIGEEDARAAALIALAAHLVDEQLEAALSAAKGLNELDRAKALSGLAPYLPREQIRVALTVATYIDFEPARADALEGLAPYLTSELHGEAFVASRAIDHEYSRGRALTAVARHLSREQFGEASSAVYAILDESVRVKALGGLAGHMTGDQLKSALGAATTIGNVGARTLLLGQLVTHLSTALQKQALQEFLSIGSQLTRPDLLRGIQSFVSVIYNIGGSQSLLELRSAIQDTSTWYP
jgi:hypothetical protein